LGSSADEEPGVAMPVGRQVRQSGSDQSSKAIHSADPEAFENLRRYICLLRAQRAKLGCDDPGRPARERHAMRLVAEAFAGDVNSGGEGA